MTEEATQKLAELSAEADQLRVGRTSVRGRWPNDFRRKVIGLARRGIKARDIARAAKISEWCVYQWGEKKKRKKFSEVHVVDRRHLLKAKVALEEITLRTPRGNEVTLKAESFRQFLQEGLI